MESANAAGQSGGPPTTIDGSDWTVLHDFGFQYGGAERVTRDICRTIASKQPMRYIAGSKPVLERMSPHHRRLVDIPVSKDTYRFMSPLYGDLLRRKSPVDGNVIASSYAFCHHVPATGARVVYCHSPFRQAWSGSHAYQAEGSSVERLAAKAFGARWRRQDRRIASSGTRYIATSDAVAQRISRYYGVEAIAIIPPAYDDSIYRTSDTGLRGDTYLWVGRIVEPYKRLGLVIEYFNERPDRQLIVAGDGRNRRELEARANENVRFLGWQSESQLVELYQSTKAIIFPSTDDFGITPVEAMACGLPVIAYRAGGALDTVTEGLSGVFFDAATVDSLAGAIEESDHLDWDSSAIAAAAAERYGTGRFHDDLSRTLLSLAG